MKFLKDVKNNKLLILMVLPGLIWYILFCYLPMFGITIAFQDFDLTSGFFGSKFVGLRNFKYLFQTSDAFVITRNTILYNFVFITFGMISHVFLAIAFDLLGKSRLNKLNQTLVLMPHFLSWMVASYFVFAILSADRGLANNILKFFGVDPINWYAEPKYWPFILFICNEWKRVGYSSVIYYSSIRGFDTEYYEAAKIDGATWYQSIFHITLPLLKPTVIMMFLISLGNIMYSDFGLFYIVPRNSGLLYSVTSTLDTYIYNGMTGMGDMSATTAASFYQSVVGFLLVLGANLLVKKIDSESALF